MSYFKTAILLAGLTGLFMGVGYLIGGASGAMIALVIAAATNLFTYWNSDRAVLSMYGAHEVDQLRRALAVDLMGAVHREHRAVRAPISEAIGRGGNDERDHGARVTADQIAHADD